MKGQWLTAILFSRNEVGQTEACQPTSLAPPRPNELALPGHGDGKLTTFAGLISNRPAYGAGHFASSTVAADNTTETIF
jgi:hypothetical protein